MEDHPRIRCDQPGALDKRLGDIHPDEVEDTEPGTFGPDVIATRGIAAFARDDRHTQRLQCLAIGRGVGHVGGHEGHLEADCAQVGNQPEGRLFARRHIGSRNAVVSDKNSTGTVRIRHGICADPVGRKGHIEPFSRSVGAEPERIALRGRAAEFFCPAFRKRGRDGGQTKKQLMHQPGPDRHPCPLRQGRNKGVNGRLGFPGLRQCRFPGIGETARLALCKGPAQPSHSPVGHQPPEKQYEFQDSALDCPLQRPPRTRGGAAQLFRHQRPGTAQHAVCVLLAG